jgi:hypothetical protein
MTDQQAECVSDALKLAVNLLAPYEPGDSRAVSDEFVALAAVSVGDMSPEVMAVIRNALNRDTEGASPKGI